MTSSLVGSEMCIRDRRISGHMSTSPSNTHKRPGRKPAETKPTNFRTRRTCLLYTSDAADDM
eukprot:7107143-Prorocentrum_lima.AAC.1